MCGCSTSVPKLSYGSYIQTQNTENIPCTYSLDTLQSWRNMLKCVKSENILDLFSISKAVLNSYIGIVISAINYPTNPCFFKQQLDIISNVILQIVNSGQCQS